MSNRLKLNWSLPTVSQRQRFVDQYLATPSVSKMTLTPREIESIANYLLWGKDEETNKNSVQDKTVLDPSSRSTWKTHDPDSLEQLLENAFFNELNLRPINEFQKQLSHKKNFSRSEARQKAPKAALAALENLWERIDRLDLRISWYEYQEGKRKEPPRQDLLDRFSVADAADLRISVENWSPRQYSLRRHELVELRTEQYTIRDTYSEPVRRRTYTPIQSEPVTEVPIMGAGSILDNPFLFHALPQLLPGKLSAHEVRLWEAWSAETERPAWGFDFTNAAHLYEYLSEDLGIESIDATLGYYIEYSKMPPMLRHLLELKSQGMSNADIAIELEKLFGHRYTDNYISTLYTKKVLPAIAECAAYHLDVLNNLSDFSAFKVCRTCKRTLLTDERNYSRRAKSKDGYSTRCKECDKKDREIKKLSKETS